MIINNKKIKNDIMRSEIIKKKKKQELLRLIDILIIYMFFNNIIKIISFSSKINSI